LKLIEPRRREERKDRKDNEKISFFHFLCALRVVASLRFSPVSSGIGTR
jgi:hypothetical protein